MALVAEAPSTQADAESRSQLLVVDRVSKHFGGIRAVNEASLTVGACQIAGIIGPNGAGKTTIFNLITGAYRPSAGEIRLRDHPITGRRPHEIARAGLARTFQNIRLFRSMTVLEHMLVAQPHQAAAWRRLLPTSWADPVAWRRAEEILALFKLDRYRHHLAVELPYGLQRRVEIARALTSEPSLLLLDEPVAGMNPQEAEDLRTLLFRLRDRGLTILLIEHDMSFVMTVCDYLYVLDFGSKIAEGEPADVQRDPVVLEAYLGQED